MMVQLRGKEPEAENKARARARQTERRHGELETKPGQEQTDKKKVGEKRYACWTARVRPRQIRSHIVSGSKSEIMTRPSCLPSMPRWWLCKRKLTSFRERPRCKTMRGAIVGTLPKGSATSGGICPGVIINSTKN